MKNRISTISVHIIAWVLLLLVPYLSVFQVLKSVSKDAHHIPYMPIIVQSLVLISLFYLNYYIFIPKYLLKKKYGRYAIIFISTAIAAILLAGLVFYIFNVNPDRLEKEFPLISQIGPIVRANGFLMLMVSFITSISLALNNQLKQAEKEKLSAQLSSLKSQINPHFLFNTLNSIYVTAIEKSPATAEMVQKLSEMMRYTMKDTQNDFVPLEDEIQYIHNYIDLQKVRLDDAVKLNFTVTGTVNEQQIAPMLIQPFIENAFKHGVNAEEDSLININIEVKEDDIHLLVQNNKVQVQTTTTESSGLGIENTRSRLQMLYPNHHQLQIEDGATSFTVSLHIQLS